jgi:putative salt-induced outer membrane protein YdiY
MITKQKYTGSRRAIVLAAALVCVGSGLAFAADEAAPARKQGWDSTAAASATLTRGNSETFLATLSLDTKRKWKQDEVALGISGGYGESTVRDANTGKDVNNKNTEFLQGYGQYNRLFSDRFYGGLRLDGKYDDIAGIDYRFTVSPMAGYYLIKNTNMTLAVEGGPSLIYEHLKGQPSHGYWAARLAERFEYKLTATTKVWESLEYLPKVDEWAKNYLLNFEAGIDTAITTHWSLRVIFQDMYASEPAFGRRQNDIRLMAGTAYKF